MAGPAVLVVSDFSHNLDKVERHVGPLATVADPTMVCLNAPEDVEGIGFVTAPETGYRPLDLLAMGLLAVVEAARGDYDAVASFSLLPHGCAALVAARLVGVPAHLGIIGIDADVHARAWYGAVVRWLMRRFDAVSVPGTRTRRELVGFGVDRDRIEVLVNPIPTDSFAPPRTEDRSIDCLWVGRFSDEKGPMVFVDAVAELRAADLRPRAVMVGDGPGHEEVVAAVSDRGLDDAISFTGWVDDPADYYRRARTFVVTSEREALPLTLLEAMACGAVPVVPDVGNVRDAVSDGHDGLVVDDRSPATIAAAVERLLVDPGERRRLAAAAPAVRERYSYRRAAADWRRVLQTAGVTVAAEEPVTVPAA